MPFLKFPVVQGTQDAKKQQDINPLCLEFRRSKFTSLIKYSLIYMKIGGIYVPSDCLCEQEASNDHSLHHRHTHPERKNISVRQHAFRSLPQRRNILPDDPMYQKRAFMCSTDKCLERGNYSHSQVQPAEIRETSTDNTSMKIKSVRNTGGYKCIGSNLKYVKKAFCLTVLAFHILDVCRYGYILMKTFRTDVDFVYSLADVTFQALFTFLFVTNSYACSRHYLPMCYLWFRYEQHYGLGNDSDNMRKHAKAAFITSIILQVFEVFAVITEMIFFFDRMRSQLWPFDMADLLQRYTAAAGFGAVIFFGCCSLFSTHMMKSVLVGIMSYEFQHLHDILLKILSKKESPAVVEEEFDQFQEQLRLLCRIMDKTYELVKHTVAASFGFTLPLLCFVLYGIVKGEIHWDQLLMAVFAAAVSLKMIVSTSLGCDNLQKKARSVWNVPYEASMCKFTPELLQKVSVFIQQVTVHDIGYSAYGLFKVDAGALLMVGGTILTYGIIVVQFRLGDTATGSCHSPNITF